MHTAVTDNQHTQNLLAKGHAMTSFSSLFDSPSPVGNDILGPFVPIPPDCACLILMNVITPQILELPGINYHLRCSELGLACNKNQNVLPMTVSLGGKNDGRSVVVRVSDFLVVVVVVSGLGVTWSRSNVDPR